MAARKSPAEGLLRLVALTAAGGLLGLTCAGCTGQQAPKSTPSPMPTPTFLAAAPTDSAATSAPADSEDAGTAEGRRGAAAVAVAAVAALCHPGRSAADWWSALEPFLTPAAAEAYRTVDPNRVPCTRVAGAAMPRSGDGFTQLVTVPTDAGGCVVSLQRAHQQDRWVADRIALPERR